MNYTVQFICGGNKHTREVEAVSEKEAIKLVKQCMYYSVSYCNCHNFKVING